VSKKYTPIMERICFEGMALGTACPTCGTGTLVAGPTAVFEDRVVVCDDKCGFYCYVDEQTPRAVGRALEIAAPTIPEKRRKPGRPSKYTIETVQEVLEGFALGLDQQTACAAAGVSVPTFCEWKVQYPELEEAVKAARSAGERQLVKIITSAAKYGAWQAAAWMLERTQPEKYGRSKLEVTGDKGGPIVLQIGSRSDGPQ
jgi:hypothetical protein